MKNIEKWRLIIQEAKAHPELYRQGERRKEGRNLLPQTQRAIFVPINNG
jgi:hypothetical protein